MLDPESAWQLIDSEIEPLGIEIVDRGTAGGRVLARDLNATVDMPPENVSAMDGYVSAGPIPLNSTLEIQGLSAAGHIPDFSLEPGQVAKIMTGAVVPIGGDRVIPIEQTDAGKQSVVVHQAPEDGAHIRLKGEVVARDHALLRAGHPLTPAAISLLASHGYSEIPVFRMPRVVVLTTGDELVPPEQEPGPGQLRDSNTSFLLAAGRSMGLEFESLGIAGDSPQDLRRKILTGLKADVLLLCGGVSKGDYDLVEEVLDELGCKCLFDAVAIQPGKPLVANRHSGGWVFGLPGNPGSVMMTFWLFVKPTLRRLAGFHDGFWQDTLSAELGSSMPRTKGRDRFFAATLENRDGKLIATPMVPRGSHDVAAFSRGIGIIRAPKLQPEMPEGRSCRVLPTGDWGLF